MLSSGTVNRENTVGEVDKMVRITQSVASQRMDDLVCTTILFVIEEQSRMT